MKNRDIMKLIRMFTFSHEKPNKLLPSNYQLSFRWQCVVRRGWLSYCVGSLNNKSEKKISSFLSEMSSHISCVWLISLMLASGLNLWKYLPCYHWNHYHAFSLVQKHYLFFNLYIQVPIVMLWALWVLRNNFDDGLRTELEVNILTVLSSYVFQNWSTEVTWCVLDKKGTNI